MHLPSTLTEEVDGIENEVGNLGTDAYVTNKVLPVLGSATSAVRGQLVVHEILAERKK